jgi:hypothetical protein
MFLYQYLFYRLLALQKAIKHPKVENNDIFFKTALIEK